MFPVLFVAGVAIAGFGIGLYLQSRLESTHQSVKFPSPFIETSYRWVSEEKRAHA